ncbi:hypothetical protein NPS01_41960 [Nocardioides psychrotolerans]|uniref:DUF1097 domain-containing protein n=2 Tax=Nocardioides psychrotolerans TaxID=1005945 RepID=A0A1I3DP18_9ACTN|nr:hypothetical protein NPS01_41960 [Nocardioides psychrotolerans]SFH88288.1 Protein of unknown function [Nocardioides psychrotolerans]
MKNYLGVGISVGVLAGLWTQLSIELTLITWVAFVAWACFFAAGGGRAGLVKGLAANVSGVLWAYLASLALEQATFNGAVAIAVALLGFVLCVQAALPLLSFIPGAFAGTALFFGTAFDLSGVLIAIVAGALLGIVSEVLGAKIQASFDRTSAPTGPAPAPAAVA